MELYFFFPYSDTESNFNIPHDLKILKDQYTNVNRDVKVRFEDKVTKIQQVDDLLHLGRHETGPFWKLFLSSFLRIIEENKSS